VTYYRGPVVTIRKLLVTDIDALTARVAQRIVDDATMRSLVNPEFSRDELRDALTSSTASTWVALNGKQLVGHLYGALLASDNYGQGVWIGPDGASYDNADVLDSLYSVAGQEWIDAGAREHYVWTLDDPSTTTPWLDLGFAKMHVRGVMELLEGHHLLDHRYQLRHGNLDDVDTAISLDNELERAQSEGPSFSLGLSTASQRDEWIETLSDPDARHFVVDFNGSPVAQCVTFPLPKQRSSFDATMHLSAVVVLAEHRGRGVARAMVDTALNDARERGFRYAATNWRISNRQANRYWTSYGFKTTYVRLHRTIGMF
jgi:ribosomal protein S18 acetylase RimI-like enzyme